MRALYRGEVRRSEPAQAYGRSCSRRARPRSSATARRPVARRLALPREPSVTPFCKHEECYGPYRLKVARRPEGRQHTRSAPDKHLAKCARSALSTAKSAEGGAPGLALPRVRGTSVVKDLLGLPARMNRPGRPFHTFVPTAASLPPRGELAPSKGEAPPS